MFALFSAAGERLAAMFAFQPLTLFFCVHENHLLSHFPAWLMSNTHASAISQIHNGYIFTGSEKKAFITGEVWVQNVPG